MLERNMAFCRWMFLYTGMMSVASMTLGCVPTPDGYEAWDVEITQIEFCENTTLNGFVCEGLDADEAQVITGQWYFEGDSDSQQLIDHEGRVMAGIGFSKSLYEPNQTCFDIGNTCWLFTRLERESNQAGTCLTAFEQFIDLSQDGDIRTGYLEDSIVDEDGCGTNRVELTRYRVVLKKAEEQIPEMDSPLGVY